tara:strand:- start:177 stop:347 length:171 start_codon:yes stop_codon:yes gene_type:complete
MSFVGHIRARIGKRTSPMPVVNVLLKKPTKKEQIKKISIISELISNVSPGNYSLNN